MCCITFFKYRNSAQSNNNKGISSSSSNTVKTSATTPSITGSTSVISDKETKLTNHLNQIEELKLIYLHNLKDIPDLTKLESLEELKLIYLHNLKDIPDLTKLESLKELQLEYLRNFKQLPNLPTSLTKICLKNCNSLDKSFSYPYIKYITIKNSHLSRIEYDISNDKQTEYIRKNCPKNIKPENICASLTSVVLTCFLENTFNIKKVLLFIDHIELKLKCSDEYYLIFLIKKNIYEKHKCSINNNFELIQSNTITFEHLKKSLDQIKLSINKINNPSFNGIYANKLKSLKKKDTCISEVQKISFDSMDKTQLLNIYNYLNIILEAATMSQGFIYSSEEIMRKKAKDHIVEICIITELLLRIEKEKNITIPLNLSEEENVKSTLITASSTALFIMGNKIFNQILEELNISQSTSLLESIFKSIEAAEAKKTTRSQKTITI